MHSPHHIPFISILAAIWLLPSTAPAQSTTRISVDSLGVQGNNECLLSSISADGRIVAFGSDADNLVPGDTNGVSDIYIHDRQTGQTSRISMDSAGGQANSGSFAPSISADGSTIAFASLASNLVPGDTNGTYDVFVHERLTGQTSRISLSSVGTQGNNLSFSNAISADGRLVAFDSLATNLVSGDTNGSYDVFVHDRQTGQTNRVSVDSAGTQGNADSVRPSLSADGRIVAFPSDAGNLVSTGSHYGYSIYIHDRQTAQTSLVSVNSSGMPANHHCFEASISADGCCVAFSSLASNLVPLDRNSRQDIFVHDLQSRQTSLVSINSLGVQGDTGSLNPSISSDGRFVAFSSGDSTLVPGDSNHQYDVFVHDRQTGIIDRVSVDSADLQANDYSYRSRISASGRSVVFWSNATDLVSGDTNNHADIFVHHRGNDGPVLTVVGSCPGTITLTISNASPDSWLAMLYGPAGAFVKPGRPCQGLTLGIGHPVLIRLVMASSAGKVRFTTNLPTAACGLSLQSAELTSCTASNVVVL